MEPNYQSRKGFYFDPTRNRYRVRLYIGKKPVFLFYTRSMGLAVSAFKFGIAERALKRCTGV